MEVRVAVVLAEGVPVLGFVQSLELSGSSCCGAVVAVVVAPEGIGEVDLVDSGIRHSSATGCGLTFRNCSKGEVVWDECLGAWLESP